MIDLQKIDNLFEIGETTGHLLQFAVFDKRFLIPLDQVANSFLLRGDQTCTVGQFRAWSKEGWFDILNNSDVGEGVPLYITSRVELFLQLLDKGFSISELRQYAKVEEWTIDNILTVDDLAYLDDDLDTTITHLEEQVIAQESLKAHSDEPLDNSRTTTEMIEKRLNLLKHYKVAGIPQNSSKAVRRMAFRIRALNDSVRAMLLEHDRGKVKSGYSILMSGSRMKFSEEAVEIEDISWEEQIRKNISFFDSTDPPPLRVPGFVLHRDKVTSTKTLLPSDYGHLWKNYDLDGYLQAWAAFQGERRCLQCHSPLESGASETRRFCSERCRNAAKQKRLRERNPLSIERAQIKYWSSLEDEEQ